MDVNHPGSQEDLVSNWEPARSLVEDAISGDEFVPCLPASGRGWAGPLPASSPLVFTQSFVFYLSLSFLFFFFFFFLSLATPKFGLLSHVSSLRLLSGHSGPVLTLSNAAHASLFSPCLLVVDESLWATSLLAVAVRCIICGFYLFIFFLPVMLPSEIPKLPTDPPVRGFLGVWKCLLFYDSLLGTGLHP